MSGTRRKTGRSRGAASGRTRSFPLRARRGRIRLIRGDCVAEMRRLKAGSVDVVVTSPPYNAGKDYGTYDDTVPRDDYLAWTRRWAKEVRRVMSVQGSLFLNVGSRPRDPWVPFDVLAVFRDLLLLQNVIHWVKSIAIEPQDLSTASRSNKVLTFGHYQPINSPRYLNTAHEFIFHLTRTGEVELNRLAVGVPYQDKSNVKRWASARDDRHCRGNTWFIPYETIQSRDKERPHPATFPVKLPEMCLRLHGLNCIRLAMDPFLGLGSTAVACANLSVPFVGFEIDQQYLAESSRWVKRALGKT